MIIGIPTEVKEYEYRVGATPSMVRAFIENGHEVRVQAMLSTLGINLLFLEPASGDCF